MFVKSGFDAEIYRQDRVACDDQPKEIKANPGIHYLNQNSGYTPSVGGGFLGAFLTGIAVGAAGSPTSYYSAYDEPDWLLEQEALSLCMQSDKGYVAVGEPATLRSLIQNAKGDYLAQGRAIEAYVESPAFGEFEEWRTTVAQDRLVLYRAHVEKYPDGMFTRLAQRYVGFLEKHAQKIAPRVKSLTSETAALTMFGLGERGWAVKPGTAGVMETDCGVRHSASLRMVVLDGIAQGRMTSDVFPAVSFIGDVDRDGRYTLTGDWPEDDPIVIDGRLDEENSLQARFGSVNDPRCGNQTSVWDADVGTMPLGQWLGEPLIIGAGQG